MENELFKQIEELPPVVGADVIAELLSVSRGSVIRWVNEGLIPVLNPGERVMRFLKEDVKKFVQASYGNKK